MLYGILNTYMVGSTQKWKIEHIEKEIKQFLVNKEFYMWLSFLRQQLKPNSTMLLCY